MNSILNRNLTVEQVRADFPILDILVNGKPLTYLDNGASSQKPLSVIESQTRFYEEQNANIHRGVHYLSQLSTRLYDEARYKTQVFLNAEHEHEVIFTAGVLPVSIWLPRLGEEPI